MVYTDEAHGYGNAGVDDPPAQTPLDSQPQPGEEAPDLNDAAWTAASGDSAYTDGGEGHTDNYTDPSNSEEGSPWRFLYDCLSFDVLSMSGDGVGPETSDGDLTGDVAFDLGDGCGAFDYGYGDAAGPGANTAPTAAASATPARVATGEQVELSAAGSDDAETPDGLDYSWDFGNGGSDKDATGRVATTSYGQPGTKTATVTVTDPQGGTDTATVAVEVVERTAAARHVNCQSGNVTRHGSWRTVRGGGADDGNYCDNLGRGSGVDRLTYSFTGRRIDLLFGHSTRGGAAQVWVDGERRPNVSFQGERSSVRINGREPYAGLGGGRHTIRIEVVRGQAYVEGFAVRG